MSIATPMGILRIYLGEHDRANEVPLYEVILARCREAGIATAAAFRGEEGYGSSGMVHRKRLARLSEAPILVVLVDTLETLQSFLPALEDVGERGLLTLSQVEAAGSLIDLPEPDVSPELSVWHRGQRR